MKRILMILVFAAVAATPTFSQSYTTGIGLKLGYPVYGGVNFKHDFGGLFGDFTLGGGANFISAMALIEKQHEIKNGFDWFYGGGLYMNSWMNNYGYYHNNKYYDNRATLGATFVFGLEYTFKEIPLNLGVDAGPVMSYYPVVRFDFGSNVAVRYVIK